MCGRQNFASVLLIEYSYWTANSPDIIRCSLGFLLKKLDAMKSHFLVDIHANVL